LVPIKLEVLVDFGGWDDQGGVISIFTERVARGYRSEVPRADDKHGGPQGRTLDNTGK